MDDRETRVGGAAIVLLGWVAGLVIAWIVAPPTAANLAVADPLVRLVDARVGLVGLPVLCALPACAWMLRHPPSGTVRRRAFGFASAGAAVAVVGLGLLRLVVGPSFPPFVPPEESAAPGLALGLGAGLLEESWFRLALLAPTWLVLRRIVPERAAIAAAVLVTAVLFAASHELGPGATSFAPRFFVTRLLVPGVGMSLLFFRPGPAFVVSLHAAAHVAIALLFTAG